MARFCRRDATAALKPTTQTAIKPLAMINRQALLEDLKRLVTRVEAALLARSEDALVSEIAATLRHEYDRARAAKRTAATYGEWREDRITQAAVAWVLSCVFVRFLEDNDLISPPRIAGPGEKLRQAREAHEHFFLSHRRETDRDFLVSIFDELAALPGTADIFGVHNALREIPAWLSGDTAREIIQFFQKIDASTGLLVHDFSDPAADTRFLGDLYQDLSAYARARYALLQTPHFIEQFLIDRTLEPALDEFGLQNFKMIDPACGSGHLILGSFERLLDRWQRAEPATPVRELVLRSLASVSGVDINPFAVAIARFRLLLVSMRACNINRLADAPAFHLDIECGDSLLHTPLASGQQELFDTGGSAPTDEECDHVYASEDLAAIKKLLRRGQYHAVMANPPYIVVRDAELNQRYRKRFSTCHRQYSLAVPFMEHIFRLCVPAGFTGQITANSFMKREFGKKLIERFFPVIDLTHVIDTSGAYIPGHGTPTVILCGRNRPPVAPAVRAVMGIRGEPSTPDDPARGLVWAAITTQVDQPGSQSEFVSVADTPRATFGVHPWSIGGGGAAELKEQLDATSEILLKNVADEVGFLVITGEDNCLLLPAGVCKRQALSHYRPLGDGEIVRDWICEPEQVVLWPNDLRGERLPEQLIENHLAFLWQYRVTLKNRLAFGIPVEQKGIPWWCLRELYAKRLRTPLSIAFAFVATHNHFVLDRGGKVFNRSAPVIKLPPDATEDDHLALLGILNSSTACFWMRQVFQPKTQITGADEEPDCVRREFAGTGLQKFPLPASRPLDLARALQAAADTQATLTPAAMIARWAVIEHADPPPSLWPTLKRALEDAAAEFDAMRRHQNALQEELDWQSYSLYGLLDTSLTYPLSKTVPPIRLGERAFEIVLARRVAAGETTTTWFERHGSTPTPDIPSHWPADYRELVQKRLDVIESNHNIGLIEQPEYKRRWNIEPWADRQAASLQSFLLDRLERLFDFDGRMNDASEITATLPIGLVSIGGLADAASRDDVFMEAAEVFMGAAGFDVTSLVGQLVESAAVPILPVLRYRDTGLRKHQDWKDTWNLQRKEDEIDARTSLPPTDRNHLTAEQASELKATEVGDIPVPPKYASADFAKPVYWSLRGKLDVPKERFVSFPSVTGADGQMMIAWAGLDHLQLAKAIGDFYGLVQTEIGSSEDPRLVPLLVAIHELLPWIGQWHAGVDPLYSGEPATFFEEFLVAEAASRSMTLADILAWQPPAATRAKKAAKKSATKRATKKAAKRATGLPPLDLDS